MHSHLRENKVFHSYQAFRLDRDVLKEPWRMANKIDSLIGQAFQVAETSCYKPPKPPWSEKLHIASLKVRFWKTALTERLTRVQESAVLNNLSAEIWKNTPPTIPTRTKILKSVGTAAQRALRRIRKNALEYVLDNKARPTLVTDQTLLGTPELNNSGTCKSSLRTGPSYLRHEERRTRFRTETG
jgi:hypothetical protein